MTNPPGAMPPLPEPWQCFQLNRGWKTWENVIPSASGEHGVVDAYTAEQLQAYAAPLIARVAELQTDAERYRWLRKNPNWLGWEHDFRPDEVDASIDAALTPTKD